MSHFTSRIWLCLSMLQLGLAFGGCGHSAGSTRPETSSERERSVDHAVADVVHARCDLEQRCSNIGPGKKFENRNACDSKMRGETASHLNLSDCPLGVEPRKLEACITSILAQDCGSMFDALSRWNACRNGQICYQ